MMDAIFGREKGADSELFSLRNGIIMDTPGREKIRQGPFRYRPPRVG